MTPERDDLSQPIHRPVMVPEVLAHLFDGAPAGRSLLVVDGTIGLGGHAEAILEARADVRVLGLDRDPEALVHARARLERHGDRLALRHASYADLADALEGLDTGPPWGVLLDLGVSSLQLDDDARGFSFQRGREGADMRFDATADSPTALDLVNHLEEVELARILREYGDEPRARAVARALVQARPLRDGAHLAAVVRGRALRGRRHDPATRSFQALRIAVNEEFVHLERGLDAAMDAVEPGGRVVVLAFHSGEDRRVKQRFRDAARAGRGRVRTKKPERPSVEEVGENRRARPARLRAFERNESEDGTEG